MNKWVLIGIAIVTFAVWAIFGPEPRLALPLRGVNGTNQASGRPREFEPGDPALSREHRKCGRSAEIPCSRRSQEGRQRPPVGAR